MGYFYKSGECFMKRAVSLSLAGIFLLTGCHNNKGALDHVNPEKTSTVQGVPAPSEQTLAPSAPSSLESEDASATGSATICQHELAALAKINPAKYATQKVVFDNLLKSASVYSMVRSDVNADTKDIMDTLYKYKTQKICNDIEQAIHDSLIARGENVK
ncbi:hypothetical protein [Atlantibacter sp.]|uniref:hypothetical protein n=1 Tax=Atlantibacter sp. TaxID=1903473 RepID=UPI0028A078C0|nr:hypothetical protein [Atlantibacter sp.]